MSSKQTSQKWLREEGDWREGYNWFLVENGFIWYAFKTREAGHAFLKNAKFAYPTMALMNLDDLPGIYLDPEQHRYWVDKQAVLMQYLLEE